jgi:PPP family 3-phenylpropionic acid transporter
LAGYLTDRLGNPTRILCILGGSAVLSTALFASCDSYLSLCVVTLISAGTYSAMLPMTDNLTVMAVDRHAVAYGRVRLWGSICFIVVSYAGGLFLVGGTANAIWLTLTGMLVVNWAATFALPEIVAVPLLEHAAPDRRRPMANGRLGGARFALFVGAAGCCQASHILYYGFGTLHWKAAGLSGPVIGFLWAEGVVAEVILFAVGDRLMRRFPPLAWIAAGGVAGMIRWSILACTTDAWLLAPAQWLHAFTYAAVQLGAMYYIRQTLPPQQSARAQGIYYAITGGVAPAIAMLCAGSLYAAYSGRAFLFMSGASAIGLCLTLLLILKEKGLRHAEQHDGP